MVHMKRVPLVPCQPCPDIDSSEAAILANRNLHGGSTNRSLQSSDIRPLEACVCQKLLSTIRLHGDAFVK